MKTRVLALALVLAALAAGCGPEPETGPEVSARERYNLGLGSVAAAEWEAAAEDFLSARDGAGPDAVLRYRAAFNLGVAQAERAQALVAEQKPEEAIEMLRQSAAWFQDAVRLAPPEDEDARANLEIVLKRIQILADELNKGQNSLEARLDRIIDDQRGLRDRIRQLMTRVEQAGAGAEPLGFQQEFEQLATFERMLVAEAGTVSDLAGEELSGLEGKPEEERSDADRVRMVQLTNMDHYLQQGRLSLADSRRLLRRLQGESAHRRADAALALAKRAREQLLDPVRVLKAVAEDEGQILMHTMALAKLGSGSIRLDEGRVAEPPPWLTSEHLGERQHDAFERTDEVHQRFSAGVSAEAPAQAAADPRQQRMIEAAREAIPHLEEALGAMDQAVTSLQSDALDEAGAAEGGSIQALLAAIELFAGVRELIEISYAEQTGVVGLLTPPPAGGEAERPRLSTAERARLVGEGVERNTGRMARLEGLLTEEMQTLLAEGQAPGQAGGQQGQDAEAAAQQQQAIRERYETAEKLRQQVVESLAGLERALGRRESAEARRLARQARTGIEELRRLFFTIVEHLKELLRNQSETHDQTATAQMSEAEERELALGPLPDYQIEHANMAEGLTQALGAQADAAAQSGEDEAQQAAGVLAEAAGEVRSASGEMADATVLLNEARDKAGAMSYDLEPVLGHQLTAMEHLENAIRLLEPHSREPQQQQQDQQQQQQQQQEEQQQMSQRQAAQRLQAIRDREAERQRNRNRRMQPEPVEKDW